MSLHPNSCYYAIFTYNLINQSNTNSKHFALQLFNVNAFHLMTFIAKSSYICNNN